MGAIQPDVKFGRIVALVEPVVTIGLLLILVDDSG